ncbi:hypothetical protein J4E93_010514 [Alternaria ventricosa]|uniref:uncharacterized protein n=1 Tax=Alternaria ventricosa TaxID=1187951 RepID=UPI0020C3CA42|nr:uncharacterized protein J4E93_010514 [Alternaria ventricosa]KAI4638046.1 hypothetical protein J4E93_010514 [Alternaria ventricosa]
MSSRAQEEEALKAAVISHGRAMFSPEYPAGSEFDVISCIDERGSYVTSLVVYPKTKPYAAGSVEEEALRATILSHIHVIHGAKHPGGSKFDVVSSDTPGDKNQFTAYVVVFPPRPLFKTVENARPVWSPIMSSASGLSVIQAYEKLLADLRKEMKEIMVEAYKKKAEKQSTMNSQTLE